MNKGLRTTQLTHFQFQGLSHRDDRSALLLLSKNNTGINPESELQNDVAVGRIATMSCEC